jgi:hypothetical protein
MAEMADDPVLKQHLSAQATKFSTRHSFSSARPCARGGICRTDDASPRATQPERGFTTETGGDAGDAGIAAIRSAADWCDCAGRKARHSVCSTWTTSIAVPVAPSIPAGAMPARLQQCHRRIPAERQKKELPRRGTRRGSFAVDAGQAGKMRDAGCRQPARLLPTCSWF